ncbi:MAG: hypothetical protein HQK57_05100 [Deltaproteobacteria bacterium]|nr:hypothetical protein [Deltaproteobacteria bacterium]
MNETIKDNLADSTDQPMAVSSEVCQSIARMSDWWPDLVRTIIVQNCYKPIWNMMNNWRKWTLGSLPMINPNLPLDPFSRLREASVTGLASYARLCDPQLKNLNTLVQEGCEIGQKYTAGAGVDLAALLSTLRKAQHDDCAATGYLPEAAANPAEVEQSFS